VSEVTSPSILPLQMLIIWKMVLITSH